MIYVEDQTIKLNGVVLPGLVKSIEVKESARIDEQEVQGSAVKPKQAVGYEDAKVNIELILDDTQAETKYQRLAVLRGLFRSPGQSVPQPLPIVSEDTAAHGVTTVLFKGLSHKAENKRGQLPVTLEFWEYIPQTITAKKSSGTKRTAANGSTGSGAGVSEDYQDYLGKSRGVTPKGEKALATGQVNKFKRSPATDTVKPTKHLDRIKKIPY